MRRVVISGLGVVSCLGNSKAEVLDSIRAGRSGITFNEAYKESGMRSHVSGSITLDINDMIDRKFVDLWVERQLMLIGYAEAIDDAGLKDDEVSNQ